MEYIFVTSLFTRRHLSFAVTRKQKNGKLYDNTPGRTNMNSNKLSSGTP